MGRNQGGLMRKFLKMHSLYLRSLIALLWVGAIFGSLAILKFQVLMKNEEKTIHVFGWPEMFLPEVLEEFERKTGIHVQSHAYTSNEELLVKLKATESKGYDLIIPSDYIVKLLVQENLLKKIDKAKLNFLDSLNPFLLHRDYDPDSTYSIPYQWEVFGLGIDSTFFKDRPFLPSWKQVFDKKTIDYTIAMTNEPTEVTSLATFYLLGPSQEIALNMEQTYKLKNLLKQQKRWVEAYAGLRGDQMIATKNCPLAICTSSYVFRSAQEYPHVKFVIPEEWSIISIENVCIPFASTKEELVYQFINYIYDPQNMAKDTNYFLTFPARNDLDSYLIVPECFTQANRYIQQHQDRFYVYRRVLSETEIRKMWVEVKSQ